MTHSFYVVGGDLQIEGMIATKGHALEEDPEVADCIVFGPGDDICPLLYGEPKHPKTKCNIPLDIREIGFLKGLPPKTRKIGLGRGAQLLNVLSGGSMWQDVDGHVLQGRHDICDFTSGDIFWAPSNHHQMMIPSNDAFLLAMAQESRSFEKGTGYSMRLTKEGKKKDYNDAEVVWYAHTKSLCCQPHPHILKPEDRYYGFFWDCVEKYLFNKP